MKKPSFDSICVFCGSSRGDEHEFLEQAQSLGALMAARGITLVYGGGDAGLMGAVSRSHMEQGGRTLGIIPRAIEKMVPHREKVKLHVVEGMHERKAMMYEKSSAFIALPGGIGTLEELFEVFTWNQLGFIDKPLGILNTRGYFNLLLEFLDTMVERGFLKKVHRDRLIVSDESEELLDMLSKAPGGYAGKWGE